MNNLIIGAAISLTMLTGCASMNNQQQSQLIGTALGTIAAHNLSKGHKDRGLAVVAGAVAGSLIGSQVGWQIDKN